MGLKRILLLLIGFPLFALLQLTHWLGFALDEIFFSAYRRIRIEKPLFITGLPRSGTTFVHRTLARDRDNFTSFRTWEAILAPSIIERRFWKTLAAIDRLVGAPFNRLLQATVKKASGDFSDVHAVGLDAEEEDYLALLPAGGCFILALAFPWSASIWRLARFSEVEPEQRASLIHFYRRILQKHLYVEGSGNKRLLSKNAAFASWIPALQNDMPDAQFIVCVRHPVSGLSSQLSSVKGGCEFFGTAGNFQNTAKQFERVFSQTYHELRHSTLPHSSRMAVIDQEELRIAPERTLKNALTLLDETISCAWETSFKAAEKNSKNHSSPHQHGAKSQSFAKASIEPCVIQDYQAILQERRNRTAAPQNDPSS